jgi:uncharacterized protein (DUF2141 family)
MRQFNIATIMTLLILLTSTVYAQTGTVDVKVTQIDVKEGGKIKIGIYDSKGFPLLGKEIDGIDIEVKGTSVTYVFKNIPAGKYAIAAFQDSNVNGELNKNMFGVPKEPYGFSNNKYGRFGPPNFEDVSFDVKEDTSISLKINLK